MMRWRVCFIPDSVFFSESSGDLPSVVSALEGDMYLLRRVLERLGYELPDGVELVHHERSAICARTDVFLSHVSWEDLSESLPRVPGNAEEIDILRLPFNWVPEADRLER